MQTDPYKGTDLIGKLDAEGYLGTVINVGIGLASLAGSATLVGFIYWCVKCKEEIPTKHAYEPEKYVELAKITD